MAPIKLFGFVKWGGGSSSKLKDPHHRPGSPSPIASLRSHPGDKDIEYAIAAETALSKKERKQREKEEKKAAKEEKKRLRRERELELDRQEMEWERGVYMPPVSPAHGHAPLPPPTNADQSHGGPPPAIPGHVDHAASTREGHDILRQASALLEEYGFHLGRETSSWWKRVDKLAKSNPAKPPLLSKKRKINPDFLNESRALLIDLQKTLGLYNPGSGQPVNESAPHSKPGSLSRRHDSQRNPNSRSDSPEPLPVLIRGPQNGRSPKVSFTNSEVPVKGGHQRSQSYSQSPLNGNAANVNGSLKRHMSTGASGPKRKDGVTESNLTVASLKRHESSASKAPGGGAPGMKHTVSSRSGDVTGRPDVIVDPSTGRPHDKRERGYDERDRDRDYDRDRDRDDRHRYRPTYRDEYDSSGGRKPRSESYERDREQYYQRKESERAYRDRDRDRDRGDRDRDRDKDKDKDKYGRDYDRDRDPYRERSSRDKYYRERDRGGPSTTEDRDRQGSTHTPPPPDKANGKAPQKPVADGNPQRIVLDNPSLSELGAPSKRGVPFIPTVVHLPEGEDGGDDGRGKRDRRDRDRDRGDRERERERDRDRDRDRERRREREREKEREYYREKEKYRERDRDRDRDEERGEEDVKEKENGDEEGRHKSSGSRRDRDKGRDRDRDYRDRDRDRDRPRDYKDRDYRDRNHRERERHQSETRFMEVFSPAGAAKSLTGAVGQAEKEKAEG